MSGLAAGAGCNDIDVRETSPVAAPPQEEPGTSEKPPIDVREQPPVVIPPDPAPHSKIDVREEPPDIATEPAD